MLQQTQAARVAPAFERFLRRYPDPASYAAASSEEVVAAWGDLGYLRRARNLHRAATMVAASGWPDDLTSLPGVGSYTAAAVASFAFGHRVAAVDINLRRVLSRWSGRVLSTDEARELGDALVDDGRPADWNQAMMDLGATLCRPTSPACAICPVARWCAGPSIELPRRTQSSYTGSVRQARAAVLKRLARGPALEADLSETDLDPEVVQQAVAALEAERVVVREAGRLRLD